jgi:predicted nuclease of restriction endonuclease-like (RecB) superfamily
MNLININKSENIKDDIVTLIESTKLNVTKSINSSLTLMFWQIGNRILSESLSNKRADYGKEIVVTLSRELEMKFGNNYKEKNLRRMIQFAQKFPSFENVATLSRNLSWSHFITLIPIKKEETRVFYSKLCYENSYSVRELRKQIEKKVFERIESANIQIHNNTDIKNDVFKDPYFLEFLDLKSGYLEYDLESAIIRKLESFILELGAGFSFVERQKRMIIDNEDFSLDLLFYHRKLKRLVAIELKVGKFKAQYKGQMELYLKWLDRYEKQDGELPPIGLILCSETSQEQIELLEMHKDGIMVAEYWTDLPPKELLAKQLHEALIEARQRLERRLLEK